MCLPVFAPIGMMLGGTAATAATATAAASAGTAATIGTMAVGTVAAGGVAAYGSYQQGQAQKNLMNYQAQAAKTQADQEAKVAKVNISGVQDQAAMDATMLNRNQSQIKGQQVASAGAQGIGSSVTAADIAKSTFTKQQMDQHTLMYNANIKSWDITNRANQRIWALGANADQYKLGADNSAIAGDINAGGSLLSTASQIGNESIMARLR